MARLPDAECTPPPHTHTHARTALQVQPEGPYLVGGHSYGGGVAMEIALVLESWGHEVGLVLVSAHRRVLLPSCQPAQRSLLELQNPSATLHLRTPTSFARQAALSSAP